MGNGGGGAVCMESLSCFCTYRLLSNRNEVSLLFSKLLRLLRNKPITTDHMLAWST